MNRTFDRLVEFDPESRSYPIRTLVPPKFRSYTWRTFINLDQGSEGACVGFAWTHDLAARPWPIRGLTDTYAGWVYRQAQKVDEWPGEDYEGTSVLAGAKVLHRSGYMDEYRWAFGLDDLRLALGYKGPAVLGLNWYRGMYEPDEKGFIHPTGSLLGGHAILAYSVSEPGEFVRLHNSWGPGWGEQGTCKVSFTDLDRLLREQGEACIPVIRKYGPRSHPPELE